MKNFSFFVLFLKKTFSICFLLNNFSFLLLSANDVQTLWEVYYSMIYFETEKRKKILLNFSKSFFFLFLQELLKVSEILKGTKTRY